MAVSSPGLFSELRELRVPRIIVEQSQDMLRAAGKYAFEALVLWAGRWEETARDIFSVEIAVMPAQQAVRSEDGVAVILDAQSLFEMNVMLNQKGLRLAAQLHTHPGEAYHSETDDRYSVVTARGGLSIVVPNFAAAPFSLDSCAVYQLNSRGKWIELRQPKLSSLICITEEL
jgi:hypothetical protein